MSTSVSVGPYYVSKVLVVKLKQRVLKVELTVHVFVLSVCGGQLTAPYGNINSPGYPGQYPPSRDCYWEVTVAPGLLITFAFGTLSLETHADCSFDFLEVRSAG